MGLGDKTATARPELAGQPPARSVTPFVETVTLQINSGRRPGAPPSPPSTSLRKREADHPCPETRMARAMKHAVMAGRDAYLAGRMAKRMYADPSSPLAGLI